MNGKSPDNPGRDDAWDAYKPSTDAPWNVARVVHLHRRAGFGATWAEIQRDLADGPQVAVERLLAKDHERGDAGGTDDFPRLASIIGDAAVASNNPNRLKAWWVYRMLFSPRPLTERLALMWHNHFATSNLKVENLAAMRAQNETLRRLAIAPFSDLLRAMLHDPAMLVWLDADRNVKGRPNENLARELLELFTVGTPRGRDSFFAAEEAASSGESISPPRKKTPDPFYTEHDVQETARALTGLAVVRGEATFRPELHDDGQKTILGQTGRFGPDDLVEILANHPATSHRLAWRIVNTFFGEGVVAEEALDSLAEALRDRDLDVGWAVSTVLRSQLFFSEANVGSRVAGPVDFVLAPVRGLELADPPPSTLILAEWISRLGQDLFYPPNVGGWKEGRAWLSTRTLIGRANYAAALADGRLNAPPAVPNVAGLLRRAGVHDGLEAAVNHLDKLLLGGRLDESTKAEILASIDETTNDKDAQLRHAVALILARPEAQLT